MEKKRSYSIQPQEELNQGFLSCLACLTLFLPCRRRRRRRRQWGGSSDDCLCEYGRKSSDTIFSSLLW